MTVNELIKKVRKIDPAAADYLENDAPKLKTYAGSGEVSLRSIMTWKETKQGHWYWSEINNKIEEQEK